MRYNKTVKAILLFVDGVGLRDPAPDNPVREDVCPALFRLLSRSATPIDACLGAPGIPQSATGQTTLFTGVNAPLYLGRHMEGFPGPSLRNLISSSNLLLELSRRGRRVRFANGYPAESIEEIRNRRFKSVTTIVSLSCPEAICLRADLLANQAVFHDITRSTLRERGYTGPLIAPQEAAEQLIQMALANDLTLFEFFLTDIAGHSRDLHQAARILSLFDAFLEPVLLMAAERELLVVLTSDHGNIEQMDVHGHTLNPVPLAAVGLGADGLRDGARSLMDVTPRILRLLAP